MVHRRDHRHDAGHLRGRPVALGDQRRQRQQREEPGLGRQPAKNSTETNLLTVAWYVLGGLAAGAAFQALSADDKD